MGIISQIDNVSKNVLQAAKSFTSIYCKRCTMHDEILYSSSPNIFIKKQQQPNTL